MNPIAIADAVSLLGFTLAMVLALVLKTDSPLVTRSVRRVFAVAMALYALIGLSNVLEHTGIAAGYDVYEDYLELLFMPAIAYVASAIYLNHQIELQRRLARSMSSQNELLLSIVDTVPGGVIVVDPAGGITFSNLGAERILGLKSDTLGSIHLTPSWTLRDPMTGQTLTLSDIAKAGMIVRYPYVVEWPDRRSTSITLSATPMQSTSGSPGGSVVAFEDLGTR